MRGFRLLGLRGIITANPCELTQLLASFRKLTCMWIAMEESCAERDLFFEDTGYPFKSVIAFPQVRKVQRPLYAVGQAEQKQMRSTLSECFLRACSVYSVHHTLPSNPLTVAFVALTAPGCLRSSACLPTSSH